MVFTFAQSRGDCMSDFSSKNSCVCGIDCLYTSLYHKEIVK